MIDRVPKNKKRGRPKGSGPYKWDAQLTVRTRKIDNQLLKDAYKLLVDNHGLKVSFNVFVVNILRDKYRNVLQGDIK